MLPTVNSNYALSELTRFLFGLIRSYDINTARHSDKVEKIAVKIAMELNLTEQVIQEISIAALLHDIGKIKISRDILDKPGSLSEAEFKIIQKHPEHGFNILYATGQLKNIAHAVLYHHEKFNGTGYPAAKKGKGLPLISRILSIADVYEAITSNRVYRKAMTREAAHRVIYDGRDTHFDPEVVEAFFNAVRKGVII